MRVFPLVAAGLLLSAACASPFGGEDIDLTAGLSTLPGVGGTIGIAQYIETWRNVRYDVELDLVHQELAQDGPGGEDDFDQVRLGFKGSFPADAPNRTTTRLGIVWLRTLGDAVDLDTMGDFGGGYVGLGYQFRLTPHLSFNPDASLSVVDSEGTGDFGAVLELTWRLVWHL